MIRPSALSALSLLFIATALPVTLPAHAQQKDEDELVAIYGDKSTVSIATGNQQNMRQAPSAATVITAREILAMGATDLGQVLETVPGLHVSVSAEGYFSKYIFRGITSEFGPQVLVLINGHKINTNFLGIPTLVAGQIPVANISRIEVIRGPGSALYGADAFAGVINIITKTAHEIKGAEMNIGLASFKGRDVWFQYGGKLGELDSAIFLQIGRNDGQGKQARGWMTAPLLPVSNQSQHRDARIDLSHGNWQLRLGYQDRITGIGLGMAQASKDSVRLPEQRMNADLSYRKNSLLPNLDLTMEASFFQLKQSSVASGFTNGVIGNPGHSERNTSIAISALYNCYDSRKFRPCIPPYSTVNIEICPTKFEAASASFS